MNPVFSVARRFVPTLGLLTIAAVVLLSSGVTSLSVLTAEAATTPSFVQAMAAKSTSGNVVSATFPSASSAGNMIVVFVVWSNSGAIAVSDTRGNAYQAAAAATAWRGGGWRAQTWYATNVQSGSTSVTATFGTSLSGSGLLYMHEYSGIAPGNALDGSTSANGGSGQVASGNLATTSANDLLFAGSASDNTVTPTGNGYASRLTDHGNLTQDIAATAAGSYNAAATQNGTFWIMQLVAFRAATSSGSPTSTPAPGSTSTSTSTSVPTRTPGATPSTGTTPLRVLNSNSHWFTHDGTNAVALFGSQTWNDEQDSDQNANPAAFNFNAYVSFLKAHGQNATILWHKDLPTYCNWGAGGTWHMGQFPWLRNGSGTATDGKPRFDLSQFDQAYFDRLRARVVQLNQNNIYAIVEFFDGLGLQSNRCGNDGFPLSGANNVNGIDDGGGIGSMTMGSPNSVTAVQDAYVRKVIDTLNDQPNVLWEVSEEAPGGTGWWQSHMSALAHAYESTKPVQHAVGDASLDGMAAGGNDWIAPFGRLVSPNNGGTVLINDSDHSYFGMWNDSQQQNRNFVWQNFTTGAGVLFMDPYEILWSGGNRNLCQNPSAGLCNGVDTRWDNLRDNLGSAASYANRMNLAAMTPQGNRSSTGFALANTASTGSEYLVYSPNGGSFTVDLSNTTRRLNVEWFNPSNLARSAGGQVTGGSSSQGFTPPFGGDAVLYVADAGTSPPTATPTQVAPTATPTATSTPIAPTATATPVVPTATATPVVPTATATPVVPTATSIAGAPTPTQIPPTSIPHKSTSTPTRTPSSTPTRPPTFTATPLPMSTSTPVANARIGFVQVNSVTPQNPQSSVRVTYDWAQTAGNTNVLAIGWNDDTSDIVGVSDSAGNRYRVAAPTARGRGVSQAIVYAANIRAAAAGTNSVTVTFNNEVAFADIRILEYSGLNTSNPLDVSASSSGDGGTATSGSAATTSANDLVVGAGMTSWSFNGSGAADTTRVITSPDSDIVEDRTVTETGWNASTAPVTGDWIMQMVAFRAAGR